MSSYQYRKSHCGDKTIVRSSYLHNGISYTGKMTSLYWIRALAVCIAKTSGAVIWLTGPCLQWERILTPCTVSMLRIDGKYKTIFMLAKMSSSTRVSNFIFTVFQYNFPERPYHNPTIHCGTAALLEQLDEMSLYRIVICSHGQYQQISFSRVIIPIIVHRINDAGNVWHTLTIRAV